MVMRAETGVDAADQVPMARPFLNAREEELVVEVLRSGRLSLGPMLDRFERDFATWLGTRHAVAVSSGTAGLHVACMTSGYGPGDEVITTPFSFVASANVIRYCGAKVVFADIDPDTLNLDPAAVAAAVTPATSGILPVHIFGYPADMEAITAIAVKHDLSVVEDACEALGARHADERRVGTTGNPAVFAFYPNKQMTTGEGGMMVTDDDALAESWRSLVNQGRSDAGQWLEHDRLGYNYRLSDVASAVGVGQLEKLDRMLIMRGHVAAQYDEMLADVPGVRTPLRGDCTRSWFVYWIVLDDGIDRSEIMELLAQAGVQSKPYLPSIHLQPAYRELGFTEGMFPVSEDVSRRSLALPFFTQMSPGEQQRVVEALVSALDRAGVTV